MQKDKKSKKKRIEKLRELLDNNNGKDVHPEDEVYLKSLSKRLKESSYKPAYYKEKETKDNGDSEEDLLKPKFKIFPREEKKVIPPMEEEKQKADIKAGKPTEIEFLPVEEKKETRYQEEDIFEIEKVKYTGAEFIEVKPKKEKKKEKEIIFEEKKGLPDKKVMEWEPIDIKREESLEETELKVKFCENCGTKIIKGAKFCEKCGNKIIEEQTETKTPTDIEPQTFIPVEPKKEVKEKQTKDNEQKTEWKPVDIDNANIKDESSVKSEPITFEEVKEEYSQEEEFLKDSEIKKKQKEIKEELIEEISQEKRYNLEEKIKIFNDLNSIDDQTAILLYDNGLTSKDALETASLKELKKIKGINRKKAKEIKEEIKNKKELKLTEFEEIIEEQIKEETEQEEEIISLCENCGAKIIKGAKFCEKCGNKIIEEQTETKTPTDIEPQTFIPVEPKKEVEEKQTKDNKQKTVDFEVITDEEPIPLEEKTKPFEKIQSIDQKTAELIYDKGITNIETLKITTINELKKIKGINRKKAKEIKEELEPKEEWVPIEIEEAEEEQTTDIKTTVSEETIEEEKTEQEPTIPIEEKTKPFQELNSIDDETAIKLYDSGYTSIDSLKTATIKELKKIKGVNKKKAKEIKEELEPKEETIEETTEEISPEPQINLEEKINAFKGIENIDENTAILLYDNGYTNIELLKDISYKDLSKNVRIKRRLAKKIIEEINKPKEQENNNSIVDEDIELSESVKKEIDLGPEPEIQSKEEITIETDMDIKVKIEVFKDIEKIDEKTAVLLYDNGFITIDELRNSTIKDLTKIKGINKKKAKEIKEELEPKEIIETTTDFEEIPEKKVEEEKTEQEPTIPIEEKTKPFQELNSIDDETAIKLYDSGYTSIDSLKTATIKELKKIKGVNKKKAKEIKEELEPKEEIKPIEEPIIITNNSLEKNELNHEISTKVEEKLDLPKPGEIKEETIEKKDEAFQEIDSINIKISKLLKENGINSIEDIKKTTIKNLCKINGIKRKDAKQIKKEVKDILNKKIAKIASKGSYGRGENPFIDDNTDDWDDWEYFDEDKISKQEKRNLKGFIYKEYTLYKRIITTKNGIIRTIRFFSKAQPEKAESIDLPKGYEVKVNKKTGVPYLRKK